MIQLNKESLKTLINGFASKKIQQPNWLENNAESELFIKNKPFYTENITNTDILTYELAEIESDGDKIIAYYDEIDGRFFPEGKSNYDITINGKNYNNLPENDGMIECKDEFIIGNNYIGIFNIVDTLEIKNLLPLTEIDGNCYIVENFQLNNKILIVYAIEVNLNLVENNSYTVIRNGIETNCLALINNGNIILVDENSEQIGIYYPDDEILEFIIESNFPVSCEVQFKTPETKVYPLNPIYTPTKMDKKNPTGYGSFSLNRRLDSTIGDYSYAEGFNIEASGDYSHAEGYYTRASGDYSHAEGYYTRASGEYSHAEGCETEASGPYSHAEGHYTRASADYSHAEGYLTRAPGECSHAEGYYTQASGDYSHAAGCYNEPTFNYYKETVVKNRSYYRFYWYEITNVKKRAGGGWYCDVINEGYLSSFSDNSFYTTALSTDTANNKTCCMEYYFVEEGYNKGSYSPLIIKGIHHEYLENQHYIHSIGNGTSSARKNLHTIDYDGNAWFAKGLRIGGTGFYDPDSIDPLNPPFIFMKDNTTQENYKLFIFDGELTSLPIFETVVQRGTLVQTEYLQKEKFNIKGMSIIGITKSGKEIDITKYCTINYSTDTIGDSTVTISYELTSFNASISVLDPAIVLVDFYYSVTTDGKYVLSDWKGTLNGVTSTTLQFPNHSNIII